jgi:hypothetical protein
MIGYRGNQFSQLIDIQRQSQGGALYYLTHGQRTAIEPVPVGMAEYRMRQRSGSLWISCPLREVPCQELGRFPGEQNGSEIKNDIQNAST